MLRFLFLNAFIAILSIIFCVWAIILSIFDKRGRLPHFYSAVPWAKIILWVCGARVKVSGQENVDRHEPRIYLSNHQSYFDIFTLLAHLPADFKFILKQELMRIPLFGFAMKRARYVAIDREEPRKAVRSINEAVSKIKQGASMLIFPEGTRSEDGKLQPFKTGGFRLALKAGCDVVPVAITNSRNIVPKGSLRINKGTIAMNIGTPISVKDYSKKDMDKLMAQVREAILSQMGESR
ncbi:MAG: lysophospholipid acyltransferase family protein [Desulfobacteraceae bacterium]|jgi:1-acyl-sn-glycerol-3-phosphate acyltransferase